MTNVNRVEATVGEWEEVLPKTPGLLSTGPVVIDMFDHDCTQPEEEYEEYGILGSGRDQMSESEEEFSDFMIGGI